MENGGAEEGSHLETHQTPTKGPIPVTTSGQSNSEPKTTVDAPVRSATDTMVAPGSASKVPTVGGPLRGGAEIMASPGSAAKIQKSVKHLECAYFFGPSPGCKWTEEQCLYSHTPTGSRAAPPVQIEPGSKFEHI